MNPTSKVSGQEALPLCLVERLKERVLGIESFLEKLDELSDLIPNDCMSENIFSECQKCSFFDKDKSSCSLENLVSSIKHVKIIIQKNRGQEVKG